jgi:glycerol-3-phosphate acyltransferase PlsX
VNGGGTTIAVDAVGGDHAPEAVVEGVARAVDADSRLEVALVGPERVVRPAAEGHVRLTAVPAEETISMDESPTQAVRAKRDSSIVVGCRLVKEGRAHGFFSAGNTGAVLAAGTLVLGRIAGVSRPAIGAVFPTPERPSVIVDIGANADCRPEHLVAFAHMGTAYAKTVLDVDSPSVGLLSIGEEPSKGSTLVVEAHELMRTRVPGFEGNVEGRDVSRGVVDVVVTDGFTGNVVLKVMEGVSATLVSQMREAMTSSPLRTAAASVLAPALRELGRRMDPDVYGGAPLLGVAGAVLIGHGSSGPDAVAAGVATSVTAVRGGLVERIAAAVETD